MERGRQTRVAASHRASSKGCGLNILVLFGSTTLVLVCVLHAFKFDPQITWIPPICVCGTKSQNTHYYAKFKN